jgi:hypothetical protein
MYSPPHTLFGGFKYRSQHSVYTAARGLHSNTFPKKRRPFSMEARLFLVVRSFEIGGSAVSDFRDLRKCGFRDLRSAVSEMICGSAVSEEVWFPRSEEVRLPGSEEARFPRSEEARFPGSEEVRFPRSAEVRLPGLARGFQVTLQKKDLSPEKYSFSTNSIISPSQDAAESTPEVRIPKNSFFFAVWLAQA